MNAGNLTETVPPIIPTETAPQTITVQVLFFGAARDAAGTGETVVQLAAPITAAAAQAALCQQFPALQRFGRALLCAVNQEYAAPSQQLADGDEIALFPPVSGGSGESDETAGLVPPAYPHDFFELTTEPLDVGAIARRVVRPECGATVTLDGYVREWTRGQRSLYLIYEAYLPMAVREMQKLGPQAHELFDITYIGIVHRIGRLSIGATSVVISVGAPHRKAAFAACEWAIKELKRTVPIWKKEFYADGSAWLEGENPPSQENWPL